jgi:hypothetical protein
MGVEATEVRGEGCRGRKRWVEEKEFKKEGGSQEKKEQ